MSLIILQSLRRQRIVVRVADRFLLKAFSQSMIPSWKDQLKWQLICSNQVVRAPLPLVNFPQLRSRSECPKVSVMSSNSIPVLLLAIISLSSLPMDSQINYSKCLCKACLSSHKSTSSASLKTSVRLCSQTSKMSSLSLKIRWLSNKMHSHNNLCLSKRKLNLRLKRRIKLNKSCTTWDMKWINLTSL